MYSDNRETIFVINKHLEKENLNHRRKELQSRIDCISTETNKNRNHADDLEQRKKDFNSMPLEKRRLFEAFGWSPYQHDKPIRRLCGTFTTK